MDEIELVRRMRPHVPAPDAERKRHAGLALMAKAAAPNRRFAWFSARPRRTAFVALVVALIAVGVARPPLGLLNRPDPAAAAALQEAAVVAAKAEPLVIGDGYLYTKIDAMWGGTSEKFSYLRPLLRETWIAEDGSGRIREEPTAAPVFLSDAERRTFIAGGFQVFYLNEDAGPGELSPTALIPAVFGVESFPTDLDALREMLRKKAEEDGYGWFRTEARMFMTIRDLLRDPLTPPEARAALFEVAATLPGIEHIGEATDHAGRTGFAIALTDLFIMREIVIFDSTTSALLEERTERLLPYGDTPPPITWSRSTYLETKVVAELPGD